MPGSLRWHQRGVARKKVSTTVYLTEEQDEFLKALSAKTNVSAAEYVRQGVDFIMAKHRQVVSGQEELQLELVAPLAESNAGRGGR